jgi:N utilization substance protein B
LAISAITKQLSEDPAFQKCQQDLFTSIFQGVINRNQELDALITPELDRPIAELSPVEPMRFSVDWTFLGSKNECAC